MTMNNYKHIEILLERFFDGNTTNEEEKELYAFFNQKDIPEHLKKYVPVFEYFDSKIHEELNEPLNISLPVETEPKKVINIKWLPVTAISIAASLLVLISINLFNNRSDNFDQYEGSYVIVDGKRITNVDEIRPQLEEVERVALQRQREAEQKIRQAQNLNKANSEKESEIEKQHYSFLDNIEDPKIKQEIINNLK